MEKKGHEIRLTDFRNVPDQQKCHIFQGWNHISFKNDFTLSIFRYLVLGRFSTELVHKMIVIHKMS